MLTHLDKTFRKPAVDQILLMIQMIVEQQQQIMHGMISLGRELHNLTELMIQILSPSLKCYLNTVVGIHII